MIVMSMRRRLFAIGGAVGAAISTGVTKFFALKGVILWLDYLPNILVWLRRCSAVVFLAFALFLGYRAWCVKEGSLQTNLFSWDRLTFWRGWLVGFCVSVVNPSGIMGTIAMVGSFAERGMALAVCLKLVAFMMITELFWSCFLIFFVSQRMDFFLRKKVQLVAFLLGSLTFFFYALRSVQ